MREWLRKWLGIVDYVPPVFPSYELVARLERRVADLEFELESFKTALKAKVAQSERKIPLYTDYEFSQVAALGEFKEKN